MFSYDEKVKQPTICNIVPGYAYYNSIGYGLAETLVNLIELLLGWRR